MLKTLIRLFIGFKILDWILGGSEDKNRDPDLYSDSDSSRFSDSLWDKDDNWRDY